MSTTTSATDGLYVTEHEALGASALSAHILNLTLSGVPFTDIVMHEDRPLKIRSPDGLIVAEDLYDPITGARVCAAPFIPTKNDFIDLLGELDENWEQRMANRAMDEGRSFGGTDRLRLNFYYEGDGKMAAVIRRFPVTIPTLEDLDAPDALINLAQPRGGLILVVGQTGVGKSTTCAAILERMANNWATHILTIEDPIEFVHQDRKATFSQRQVGSLGLSSMALGIEDALRQAPGIIYISEIRDRETADAAFFAMDSGHLVIANLHARTPLDGIARLLRIASGEREARESRCHALATNLIGAVAQILVPVVDESRRRVGFKAFYEVLTNGAEVQTLIAKDKLDELQIELQRAQEGMQSRIDNTHWMNADLAKAISDAKVLQSDAISRTINVKDLERRIRSSR